MRTRQGGVSTVDKNQLIPIAIGILEMYDCLLLSATAYFLVRMCTTVYFPLPTSRHVPAILFQKSQIVLNFTQ